MTAPRAALVLLLALTAAVAQTAVLAPLGLPGATPDPLLLVVVGLAQAWGPLEGAVCGFAVGLVADLVPPAVGPVGRWAAVFTLVGLLVGRAFEDVEPAPLRTLAAVALAAPGTVVGSALLAALVGDPGLLWSSVPRLALTALGYDVLLAMLVVPLVLRLARAAAPDAEVRP